MENGDGSSNIRFVGSEFWMKYNTVRGRLNDLKRKNVQLEQYNPVGICEEIEEILAHDEEESLSFLHNKIRKLSTGSELCRDICALQRHFSKLEINRAVSEILEEEKYEKIANRIYAKKNLEARREKYFLKQALNTIRNSIGDDIDDEEEEDLESNSAPEDVPASEKGAQPSTLDPNPHEYIDGTITNLRLSRPEAARDAEDLDQLQLRKTDTRRDMTEIQEEEGVFEPEMETRPSAMVTNLTPHLEEVVQNGSGIPSRMNETGIPEVLEPGKDDLTLDVESLPPPVKSPAKRRRKIRPVLDRFTVIPNYRERARRLNELIIVKRIQVYEGPQSIIQSLMVNHLFETPAVSNRFSKRVCSSVLDRLYKRNLITEKKPHMDWNFSVSHSTINQTVQENSRTQFHPEVQQGSETIEASIRPDSMTEKKRENLVGMPVSKILEREAPSPQIYIGPSNPWIPSRSPRIQNMQGKTIDPPISEPWFQPVQQSFPDEKWREFSYVRKRLHEVWSENGTDRGANLHEVLGDEWSKENMLTLLRIVDKMSIKREVVLDGISIDIVIRPFQVPYVTQKQYAGRFDEPKY